MVDESFLSMADKRQGREVIILLLNLQVLREQELRKALQRFQPHNVQEGCNQASPLS